MSETERGKGTERDVRPRQANRAAEEVRASQGVGSEGTLSQGHGNPRRREQCSEGRRPRHRESFLALGHSFLLCFVMLS